MAIIRDLKDFVDVHGVLLAASGLPPVLYHQLFEKLCGETFDGGSFFQIELCENGRQKRLVLSCDTLAKDSHIFLVDHAWSFRLPDGRNQLQELPELVERMATLMCVRDEFDSRYCENVTGESEQESTDGAKENPEDIIERELRKAKEGKNILWLELEQLQIDDEMLCSLELMSKFPNLVGLDLWGNKLENIEAVIQTVGGFSQLRALWLNENPASKHYGTALRNIILQLLPQLEIYNSQFTNNYSQWALGFCAGIYGAEKPVTTEQRACPLKDVKELDLSNRSIHNISNKVFNPLELPLLTYLNLRGNPLDQNSVENLLELLHGFVNLQSLEVDIPGPLGSSAVKIAEALPNLSGINGVGVSEIMEEEKGVIDGNLQPRLPERYNGEPLIDRILQAMWLYLMTYRLADEEKLDETPVWYVMDELGLALRHSDVPNFKIAPFLFMSDGELTSAISYSVMWPTNDVHKGQECTRDYLPGIGEDKQRSSRLTAWFHTPENYFIQVYEKYCHKLHSTAFKHPINRNSQTQSIRPTDGRPLLVYTDNVQVEEFLNRPEFVFTDDALKADIVWTSMQVDEETKKIAGLKDHQYVNQFPFEACIVMKHHLAETIQQAHGDPEWFQITYNLETQLSELIGDYLVRDREGRNNLWILKPWNMARTIDTTITGHLPAIIRLMETGPKICQKYIENPILFKGRKFDLRYIVLLRSVQPLEILLSDNFWVRLANNQYTLKESSLSEYETHFTVMNYRGHTANIRKGWVLRQLGKLVIFTGVMGFIVEQYMNPIIKNSQHPLKGNILYAVERVLKLSIPTLYVWLCMFYCFFHLWLNIVAELVRFGDREFYKDWWNAKTVEEYWRMWNMPVHKWMVRHIYFPCLRRGIPKSASMVISFFVSAVFHELCIGVPCHMLRSWAFMGIMVQIPLVVLTSYLQNKFQNIMVGNIIFWFFFSILGQPMCVLLYYHDVINQEERRK